MNPRPKQGPLGLAPQPAVERPVEPARPAAETQPAAPKAVKAVAEEKIHVLENEKLRIELSNLGGTLKKVTLKDYATDLPLTQMQNIRGWENVDFRLDIIDDNLITYTATDQSFQLTKEFRISDNDYLIYSNITIANIAQTSKKEEFRLDNFRLDISRLDNKANNPRDRSLFEYTVATDQETLRKGNAVKFSKKERKEQFARVNWLGFRDRYYCAVFKPTYQTSSFQVDPLDKEVLILSTSAGPVDIPAGGDVSYENIAFFGPQKVDLLKSYDLGIEDMMKFSNWGIMDGISKGIYKLMGFMYKIIPNWGVCIIIVSLLIYGAMYPLTMKGMLSMKRMQALQPKITKLRDQNKNNPQKLNKEIMELYKEHKVNPLGGCFPLLLQMPVFIGLYQVLWRSVSFKGASFLWIKDLSEPDRLMIFPFTLPVVGNELNILPIIMIAVMVLQQKISAKNMVMADPTQAAQQKIMMTVFPLFIGFIFYKFASGLALYFTVFYVLSTFTQWKTSKMTKVA